MGFQLVLMMMVVAGTAQAQEGLPTLITNPPRRTCGMPFITPHFEQGSAFPSARRELAPHSDARRLHAILLYGGYRSPELADRNYVSFWNDLSLGYIALRQLGVPRSQVHVLMGSGDVANSGIPMKVPATGGGAWGLTSPARYYYNAPTDLDCNGVGDINGVGNRAGLRWALGRVALDARPGDVLLIAVIAHGSRRVSRFTSGGFILWNEENLNPEELGSMLSVIPPSVRVALALNACYGGQFNVLGGPRRCVLTSAPADEIGHTGGDADYTPIFSSLWGSLLGVTPWDLPRSAARTLSYGDLNNDGQVDLREVYGQMAYTTYRGDHPDTSDSGLRVGETIQGYRSVARIRARALRRALLRPPLEAVDAEGLPTFDSGVQFQRGFEHLMERPETECSAFRF